MGFVVERLRDSAAGSRKLFTVSVSSRPSRSDAAADGCYFSRLRARFSSSFRAVEADDER